MRINCLWCRWLKNWTLLPTSTFVMIRADTGIVLSLPPPQPITAGSHKVRTKWCSILSGRAWMFRTGSVHSKRCRLLCRVIWLYYQNAFRIEEAKYTLLIGKKIKTERKCECWFFFIYIYKWYDRNNLFNWVTVVFFSIINI